MTAAEDSALRVALANGEALRAKRNALQVALASSAAAFHRGFKHAASDWRGNCSEPECKAAWAAMTINGGK